jgi:hypothetical protein
LLLAGQRAAVLLLLLLLLLRLQYTGTASHCSSWQCEI